MTRGGSDTEEVRGMVDLLHKLAAKGPALEFAIGTGRIALPLLEKGVPVKGIELSRALIAELRKKETGPPIEIAVGDMATTRLECDFSLIYLVYNTIDNLTSQDEQISCFQNAYAHLRPGGRFLIETLDPPIQKIPTDETLLAYACSQIIEVLMNLMS
jgi:SAM-dependent methyltransferase